MSDLQENQRQVLNEEQRVHQRGGIFHNPPVIPLLGFQHTHAVKQPVRCHEQEDQHHQQTAEDKETRERGTGAPEEQRPGGDEQDQEFEGQGDVKAFAGGSTRLEGVTPQDLREDEEGQRRDQGKEAQAASQGDAEETLALQRGRLLQVFGDSGQVFVRYAVLRGARHNGGGLAPVIVLKDGGKRSLRCLDSGRVIKKQTKKKRARTDPVISAGRLCVQQWLSGGLDGHGFVAATAAVSTFRAMAVPPIPGRQIQTAFSSSKPKICNDMNSGGSTQIKL